MTALDCLKFAVCLLLSQDFLKGIPAQKAGVFLVRVDIYKSYTRTGYAARTISGSRRAYVCARWWELKAKLAALPGSHVVFSIAQQS